MLSVSSESDESVDDCIFTGFLRNESNVAVTLTGGCPFDNTFEVARSVASNFLGKIFLEL
jgi:hypothetical protein